MSAADRRSVPPVSAPPCYKPPMGTEPHQAAAAFYATAQGAVALRLVRERLVELWPDLAGQTVLGLGYAGPYLRIWQDTADRCIAATPAPATPCAWPGAGPSLSCWVEENALPLPGQCIDRVLLVHGLENAENARRMLREVWRVLKDDGRVLVLTPNRVGLWAHVESTPFGQGQPYSQGQIGRLLAASLFRVERRDRALYMPPSPHRLILRTARVWERAGRRLAPQFAGVTITEAVKDVYAALPLAASARRRLVLSKAA
jgi:SAM-dependent methyltransferase